MTFKPSIPKGTRDFSPSEVNRRNYIIEKIRKQFEYFGFQPIETPSFENSDTLMGKYGEEGDRLIFKILNSGDYLSKADQEAYVARDSQNLTPSISEKALRYDLTVPFARYVVQHRNSIEFPFKRYQIQPVWRADRPQKGRFREFYQCDADVVGSSSLWQEVELVQLYDAAFYSLNLQGVTIKMNNRKILAGFAEVIGESEKLMDFTVALDKLDKIGEEGVKEELRSKGISSEAIDKISGVFNLEGKFSDKISLLKDILSSSKVGIKGIEELVFVYEAVFELGLKAAHLELDVTLARGLNYYTGAIFEVSAPKDVAMGSIGGGGRYDDLTGIFGLRGVSGVGISFGLDRIYLVLEELDLFPPAASGRVKAMFINFGDKESRYCLQAIKQLRSSGIAVELYPEEAKMKKQMNHANKREIPFVILAGEEEIRNGQFTLKNMQTGRQDRLNMSELLEQLSK